MEETTDFSGFIFKENLVFIKEEGSPSKYVVIVEEELDKIDVDGIGELQDLPRLPSSRWWWRVY